MPSFLLGSSFVGLVGRPHFGRWASRTFLRLDIEVRVESILVPVDVEVSVINGSDPLACRTGGLVGRARIFIHERNITCEFTGS